MRRDLKTGMLLGVVLVAIAAIVISIYSSTVESRLNRKDTGPIEPVRTENIVSDSSHVQPAPQTSMPDSTLQPDRINTSLSQETTIDSKTITQPKPKINSQTHIVAPGETLSAIATLYYGSVNAQQRIINANPDVLTDVDKLRPGMKLIIPLQ